MKSAKLLIALVLVAICLLLLPKAWSQGGGTKPATPASSPTPQAQQSPQPAPSIAGVVERQVSATEKLILEAAEAMPEDKFNFTPTSLNIPGSDYKGVRSFALQVRHIATVNYVFWSPLTGDPVPAGIKGPNWRDTPEELKTKAEIIKFLKDSYALGHKAAATLSSDKVVEQVPFRDAKAPRLHLATFAVIHANDHYGQMVEYLRMNGIVPPASRGK
jgi:uncharacterized damage-inducible protein DinB